MLDQYRYYFEIIHALNDNSGKYIDNIDLRFRVSAILDSKKE